MTVRKDGLISEHRRRVSINEVWYPSISEAFRIVYGNGTKILSMETTSAAGGFGMGKVATLPNPHDSDGWLVFERNGPSAMVPDVQF